MNYTTKNVNERTNERKKVRKIVCIVLTKKKKKKKKKRKVYKPLKKLEIANLYERII